MNKKMVLVVVVLVMMASCAAAPQIEAITPSNLTEYNSSSVPEAEDPGDGSSRISEDGSAEDPGDSEVAGVLFMREEEKLARDVYFIMAETWGQNIFAKIASSESAHMDAVLTLIVAAGQEDPAEDMAPGEFKNEDLQILYDELISRGSQSLEQALLVGGAIEEIDILDLQEFLAKTDDPEIRQVYQNLLKGSINHLNSFVRSYQRQTGEVYQPQFLSPDQFAEMIRGNSVGQGGMSQGRGQGGGRLNK